MACGETSIPMFGCCPDPDPWIIGRSWLAAYTITAWGTPMSYLPADEGQEACVTGYYATRKVEYYSYTDFDFNQPVLMQTDTSALSLPGGQLTTTRTGSGGAFGGGLISHIKLLEDSGTTLHLGAFRNHPDTEASAVNSIKVTLSNPFNPELFWNDVHGELRSKFDEPWDPEGQRNTQTAGPVPPLDWMAYWARDNTLVCGHYIDIVRERGLGDLNFFIPSPQFPGDGADVCGMEAYSFKEATMLLIQGSGVNVGGTKRYMLNPVAYYNKVWRRVEWAWFGGGPFFEWQRDDVSIWGPDGCTQVRSSACPRPLATRCEPLPAEGRILREPPVEANGYGRKVWGKLLNSNCQ